MSRRSASVHTTRGHQCEVCPRMVFGNGGKVAHGRGHVRRGEAVELVWHTRLFLAPDNERIPGMLARGFVIEVEA